MTLTPIPSTTRPSVASARMPATLRPPTSTSFGCLSSAASPVTASIAVRHRARRRATVSSGQRAGSTARPQLDESSRLVPAGDLPAAPEPPRPSVCSSATATAPSGASDGEQPLRRRRRLDVELLAPEAAAEPRQHGLARRRAPLRHYTSPAVQPPRRKARQIVTTTRREPPLVYEKLSDPILVRRAKDGDRKALDALRAARAARRAARAAPPRRPRGRARRRAGVARQALRPAASSSAARRSSRPGCTGCREHVPRRGRPPAHPPPRAAARRPAHGAATPTRRARPSSRSCGPSWARASPSCRRRRRVSSC